MPTMKTLTVDGKTYTIEDSGAQRTLVSGINIKTINNESLLGSGNITLSSTDEKMKWTVSTASNTFYPLQSTSTATTSTANTLNGINFYQYYNTAGGYRRLNLGNTTAYKSSDGAYGTIRLYGTGATYYGDINPGTIGTNSLTENRTWTLPDKTGTIALTSDEIGASHVMVDSGYYTDSSVDVALDDLAGLFSYTHVIDYSGTGSPNTWNYRKWSDGTLECWARFYTNSMKVSGTTGSLKFASFSISNRNYPVAFVGNYPTITVSGNVTNGNGWAVMNNTDYSLTAIGTIYIYAPISLTNAGVAVNVYAIGKWK